jgi:hypothetical protein
VWKAVSHSHCPASSAFFHSSAKLFKRVIQSFWDISQLFSPSLFIILLSYLEVYLEPKEECTMIGAKQTECFNEKTLYFSLWNLFSTSSNFVLFFSQYINSQCHRCKREHDIWINFSHQSKWRVSGKEGKSNIS